MTDWEDRFFEAPDGLRLHLRDYPCTSRARGTLLCLHGLTRNAADFEPLAERYRDRWRLVVPEQRGRGRSDHDPDPSNYHPGTYVRDTLALIDHLGLERPVAVGTSMGGLMAAFLAAARPGVFRAAVLNDIGPVVEAAGLERIRGYVGRSGPVGSWTEAVERVRAANAAAYPDFAPEDWLVLARRLYVRDSADGTLAPAYDAAIALPLNAGPGGAVPPDPWPAFEALGDGPVLLLRGACSDILSDATARAMARRLPRFRWVQVPRTGHAPTLAEPAAREALDAFLAAL